MVSKPVAGDIVEERACSCHYTLLKLQDDDLEVRKQQGINQQNLTI